MVFLFFLVLILFGPKKLPEIAREAGKLLAEFRRASNDFKQQLTQEIDKDEQAKNKTLADMAQSKPEEATKSSSFTQSLLPAGVKTAISEIDNAHDRLMQTAKLAFEAQNFTLRAPDAPAASAEDVTASPAEAAAPEAAPATETAAKAVEPAPAAESTPAQQGN